ncbi:THUMP domain-containing protein 1 homolog [Tribolium castaneum]|uniref:THUMP domain-containing protein 1 homolog-like Protein n=1 Tax=Tribolium castaneum TaxID=7070 RepID=D6WGN0_TRICA|nr:PREDICTED: THUMP domain-containing protein 1 homolog [Tribolium castaneum]XP_015833325.1 PREDICTED: THUMP domain-containing protein 1 homolog [Tribolium castaneum]XP_972914.1 PREDICTED: THUMP domain-containing protein 1 homolog [Tribolium castaneum]EFA00591.1 THUMP domain-containing protein 1 homolog-like Protein [Tribolium castaneum]|eukprot:XP_008190904.1 PREDICTED: THUMP domain-containing protein 1 homolog [Tribolium castaneum]
MSKPVVSKQKSKKYYFKKTSNKRLSLDVNLRGFLCSCNNREKDCIKESYNLLNEYADKLYQESNEPEAEQDIDDSLAKEISELKQDKSEKRFQVIESGAKNFLFIRTSLENPVELAEAIIKDVDGSKTQRTKFLLRLIPVEITCKANVSDIVNAFVPLAQKHFVESPQTFCVIFNHRNNNVVSRDEVIKLIAAKVSELRPDHKVDLKEAKVAIIVEVIKGFAFLSVIPDYLKHKKYNLLSLCSQEQVADCN